MLLRSNLRLLRALSNLVLNISSGDPIPGNIPDQVGQGSEHPDLSGVPACCGGVGLDELQGSLPTQNFLYTAQTTPDCGLRAGDRGEQGLGAGGLPGAGPGAVPSAGLTPPAATPRHAAPPGQGSG